MTICKIFVLGAGAIGSIVGALLSKKNDVTLIAEKFHADVVNSSGLTISGDVSETYRVGADTQIHEIPRKTVIFLTTKAYDIEIAIRTVHKLLRKDTVIVILQNGLGNEAIVESTVGDKARVLRGITNMAAEFFEAGKIRYWKGETIIEQDSMSKEIANNMNGCSLKTRLSKNMNDDVWSKAVVNCVVNPLTAIFRVRNREIATESLAAIRNQVVQECVHVAKAEGAALPKDIETGVVKEILAYANYSSMCQDILKGKKTEIDFLNGKIVELGLKHSIPTPVNETLVHFIKFLEEKNELSKRN